MKRKNYIALIVFAVLAAALALLPVLTGRGEDEDKAVILSAGAEQRELAKKLYTGGALTAGEAADVTVPEGVRITAYTVSNGDLVQAGDPIALPDRLSVMTAVTQVQDAMQELKSDIDVYWNTTLGAFGMETDGTVTINGKEADAYALANSAEYQELLDRHRRYEEQMLTLFTLYQDQTVKAPADGMIDGLDESLLKPLSGGANARLALLAANTPYGDDEKTYRNYVGTVCALTPEGLEMRINPAPCPVEDYLQTQSLDLSPEAMTESGVYAGLAPVFEYADGQWVTVPREMLAVGDVLLFAYDGGAEPVWIVRLNADTPEQEEEDPQSGDRRQEQSGTFTLPSYSLSGMTQQPDTTPTVTPGDVTLCRVIPMDEMTLTARLDEQDIRLLSVGKTVTLTLDALPGQSFTATVSAVSTVGDNNGGSSKFDFDLTVPRAEGMLPGMNASVIIDIETLPNVLTIPSAALYEREGKTVVYTALDEKSGSPSAPREVETGFSDGEYVGILSGLTPGEQVFYEYYEYKR